MKRIFEFVDQIDPTVLPLSGPVENGQQVEITDAPVRFLLERKTKLVSTVLMDGYETLIDNPVLTQTDAESHAILRHEVSVKLAIGQLAFNFFKRALIRGHLGSRHRCEADVGDARIGDCQPLPNSGTKILIVRDLLRHEDVTCSASHNRQSVEPLNNGSEQVTLVVNESGVEAGFKKETVWLHRLRRGLKRRVVLKIAVERDLLAVAHEDRLLIF